MSRLDSFLRRITAQRDCLDHAATLIAAIEGPIVELGLGNGRTFDHLRALFPHREIFAFDRRLAADPASAPDPAHLVLGDFRDSVPAALTRIGAPAALVHCDFGSGRPERDRALAASIAPMLLPILAKGAVAVSDQALDHPSFVAAALPGGVEPGRYFIYRIS